MPRHYDAAHAALPNPEGREPTIDWASVPERQHITSTEEFRSLYMCQPVPQFAGKTSG